MRKIFLAGLVLCVSIAAVLAQDRPDALAMYLEGRYEEAIEVCIAEIEALPRNMDSYVVMGWSLIELERYEEASEQAKRALAISPYDPRVAEIAGEALYYLGDNQEALKHLVKQFLHSEDSRYNHCNSQQGNMPLHRLF